MEETLIRFPLEAKICILTQTLDISQRSSDVDITESSKHRRKPDLPKLILVTLRMDEVSSLHHPVIIAAVLRNVLTSMATGR